VGFRQPILVAVFLSVGCLQTFLGDSGAAIIKSVVSYFSRSFLHAFHVGRVGLTLLWKNRYLGEGINLYNTVNLAGVFLNRFIAFEPSGHTKHSKYFRMSGNITVYDAVSVISLGGVPFTGPYLGWPLCSFYLYGYEIKRVLEMTLAMGGDFFLQISGLRYTYTPLLGFRAIR